MRLIFLTDYEDNQYPLIAVKKINQELNGNHSIELDIPQQKNNKLDLKTIDKLWTINYKQVDYKIIFIKQITKGDSFHLNVRAIPLFYWDFDKQIIHENKDGHYTAKNAFDVVFNGTGYQYVLVDFVEAIQIEGFGKGETRLEMFKRLIERFGLEFYIVGKTVYLKKLIGNDTNFQYRYKLNASNVSKSVDASNYFTHIKGFGNFEEGSENYLSEAKLKREYTSPLASVLGVYEGKPIIDGRIKDTATMDANLKKAVEESLEISIEGNLHDVRSIYAEAVPTIGDRVFLIDERIGLEQEIRIHTLKRTYDINDKLIDCEVTFGSQSIRDRHKSNLNSAAKDFTALMKGDIKLPTWSLDEIARGMITKIHASENELRYGDFGIQAIDKNNPNNVFGLNSQGWYISTDGGATARTIATAEGIVADAITTGTLRSIYIEGVEIYGSYIESRKDNDEYVYIDSGAVMSHGKFARTWAGETDTANLEMGLYNGQLRVRNKDTGYRLYLTERGLSTSMEGAIDEFTSGTLEFHSQRFNPNSRGVTMHSSYGAVAMVSDYSTAVIRSNLTANIESDEYSVYIRPYRLTRGGINDFRFWVKDGADTSGTDGVLSFGNTNVRQASGIRFQKSTVGTPTVWITNGNGDIGTGNAHANAFIGELQPRASYNYLRAERSRFVMPGTSSTNYAEIQFSKGYLNSLSYHGDGDMYIGVSTNELRITNNLHWNGGNTGFRPIRASAFNQGSSLFYKTNIKNIENIGLSVIRDLTVVEYDLIEDINNGIENRKQLGFIAEYSEPIATIDNKAIDIYRLSAYNTKAIQELAHENDELKSRIEKLEEIIYATK